MAGAQLFTPLFAEAVRDAFRRRIVFVVIVVCVLSVFVLDTCTPSNIGQITINGESRPLSSLAGAVGALILVVLGMWVVALAGVLASDHLSQALEDGSAHMALARPVARSTYALSRLAGVLAIAFGTGAVLLGAATFLLATRGTLPPEPALAAAAACALSCVVMASLAMAASLVLPRVPVMLLVFAFVGLVGVANAAGLASAAALEMDEGARVEAIAAGAGATSLRLLDELGPPFATAMVVPLSAWVPELELPGDPTLLGLRLLAWAGLGLGTLWAGFRRLEI